MRRVVSYFLVVAGLLAFAAPASAFVRLAGTGSTAGVNAAEASDEPTPEPTVTTEPTPTPSPTAFVPIYTETQVYLHCNGDTKAGQVNWAANNTLPTWDTTKPATSYQAGGGCGNPDTYAEGTADHNPVYDFPFEGYYTGNINNMTIRLWAIDVAGSRALEEFTVDLHVLIDGVPIIARGTVADAPMINSSTGLTRLYEVTITHINLSKESDHLAEHYVQVTPYVKYIDGSGVLAWVYDATEIDSGIVFNDTTPAITRIKRNG